jgi:phytoene dehydrogenase-like protein
LKAHSKTLVIGAGGGGIASALLAALRGEDVTLLESHYALGGCASYFKRGQFVFDAGATTLSGVGVGEPLGDLFELLGRAPSLKLADPGIVFHLSNGKVVRYFHDFTLWMDELETHFPGLNHKPFWDLIFKINHDGWKVLKNLYHPKNVKLLPYLFISTDLMLKKYQLDDPVYRELLNGILLISAQAHAEKVPFLVGAMALSYPANCFAPIGGMKGFMDFLERELQNLKVDLKLKTKVETLPSGFDKTIANIPLWNLVPLDPKLKKESEARPGSWGALTLYFGVKSDIQEPYHQVHFEGMNYFISFSLPGDELRAPAGFQAVTISTHVDAKTFSQVEKENLSLKIMSDFMSRFSVGDIKHFTIGTPKTFERYTGRQSGFVGGIPLLLGQNPIYHMKSLFSQGGLYRVGDTVFPGQGICGVVAGALLLHRRLLKKEL